MGQAYAPAGVLVVEDELLIALLVEEYLRDLGFERVYVANDVATAEEYLHSVPLELAVLDVNVGNHSVFPVAAKLQERNIPFVFSTARSRREIPTEWLSHPLASKPMTEEALAAAITASGVSPRAERRARHPEKVKAIAQAL